MERIPNKLHFFLKAMGLLVLSLSFFMCSTQKQINYNPIDYKDTSIVIPSVTDSFQYVFLVDTIYITKDSARIEIINDSNNISRLIYHKPQIELIIDSVIQWRTIKERQVIRITKHECQSSFHNFCVGLFWLTLFLLIIRIIIQAVL